MNQISIPASDPALVLGKAVLRARERLGLTQAELARIIGVSDSTVSRLATPPRSASATSARLDPNAKEGELALLFLRVFRSLDALLGGDETSVRAWFHAHNTHIQGVPAKLVQRVDGLVHVAEYLDAMRGQA